MPSETHLVYQLVVTPCSSDAIYGDVGIDKSQITCTTHCLLYTGAHVSGYWHLTSLRTIAGRIACGDNIDVCIDSATRIISNAVFQHMLGGLM